MTSKKILFSLFGVLFLIGGFLASGVSAVPAANVDSTEILIGFENKPGLTDRDFIESHGGKVIKELNQINVLLVELPARTAEQAMATWAQRPQISFVEENGLMYAHSQMVPWGVERIGAVEAHEISTGTAVGVAILDTGIDPNHEDLRVAGGYAVVTCRGGCAEPWDDDHGHGTHVAGTAAAINNDLGVLGVAHAANLYAVKVLANNGRGTWAGVAEGIVWAAGKDIEVINMSLGGGHSNTLERAVKCAYYVEDPENEYDCGKKGSLIVASAGNSGPGEDTVGYPAAYEEVIAVSATDDKDNIASWSSRGEEVELAAPGVSIYSTLPGNSYGTYSGTSMAAPHVAGTAALAWATDVNLTNIEVREMLQKSAEDIGLTDTQQGYGLVNASAAVGIQPPATGGIKGTVKDGGDATIKGASVAVEGTSLSATTDTNGYYLLENVPVGAQKVTASADGYDPETVTIIVVEDSVVTQDFVLTAIPIYTIIATVNENGTIDPSDGVEVYEGEDQTFSITPDAGYEIGDVEVNDESVGAVESYTFKNVISDHKIHAIFAAVSTYTVSGTVKDTKDNTLEGATVAIEGTELSATTESDGTYSISDVEEGSYNITASKSGYSSQTKTVTIDNDSTVDFALEEITESEGLVIDKFELTNTSNPAWARVTIEWAVSSDIGLASVKTEMIFDGSMLDSKTSSVSGSSASGTHELRVRGGHGKTYEIILTVTDIDGNKVSETKSIKL